MRDPSTPGKNFKLNAPYVFTPRELKVFLNQLAYVQSTHKLLWCVRKTHHGKEVGINEKS